MRLAVLADIHANLPALEAVLADARPYDPDRFVVAGDLVGGPRPMGTVRLLRALDSWMIRGNTDSAVVRFGHGQGPSAWGAALQYALLRWGVGQLDQATLHFLASLPEQRVISLPGTDAIRLVHGSPRHPAESIYPNRDPTVIDEALGQISEPVLICGHTHEPWVRRRGDRLALNPGSVGGPLNGHIGAQYALLTWRHDTWSVEQRAISYDMDRIGADFEESGLLTEGGPLALAALLGVQTGQNVMQSFLSHARGIATRTGFAPGFVIPDEAWLRAAETFDWDGVAQLKRGSDSRDRR